MNESSLLVSQQISQLLPILPQLAANVRDWGAPETRDLQMLLQALDMAEDGMMLLELARWARILAQVRGEKDAHMLAYARSGLQLRGIPEANAILAVSYASAGEAPAAPSAAPVSPAPPPRPAPAPRTLRASADVVGFGLLKPGETGTQTIYVEGGPGVAKVACARVTVEPAAFGPERTPLVITVQASGESSLLLCPCSLESASQRLELDIVAEWGSLPAKSETFPLPPPIPAPTAPEPARTQPDSKSDRRAWPSGRWKS